MAVYTSNAIITYHDIDHPAPWAGPHTSDWADYNSAIANLQKDGLLITRHFFRATPLIGPLTHRLNITFDGQELRYTFDLSVPGSNFNNLMYDVDTISGTFTSADFSRISEIRKSIIRLILACHITEWDRTFTY